VTVVAERNAITAEHAAHIPLYRHVWMASPYSSDAVKLKDVFCKVDPDQRNLFHGWPPYHDLRRPDLGTMMPLGGHPPHQSQILARHGVNIERSTLAQWIGAAAAELQPLNDRLIELLTASPKLFCDETRCPVLDPGRGKTKTGFIWAMPRDDRPWGGSDPPAVAYAYRYTPDRKCERCRAHLAAFRGHLHADGYAGFADL